MLTVRFAPELLLDLLKDGTHAFMIEKGVPDDAVFERVDVDANGTVVVSFTSEEAGGGDGIVLPESSTIDVDQLVKDRDMLAEAVETFGLQKGLPEPVRHTKPSGQAHGSLNPTDGRTGRTPKAE